MRIGKFSALILAFGALGVCMTLPACQSAPDDTTGHTAGYRRKPVKSLAELERAYKKAPQNALSATAYAAALRKDDQAGAAAIILEPFLKAENAAAPVSAEYAAIKLAAGDYQAAQKYAQQAISADHNNFTAYHRLGAALDAQGLHEDGERAYRKALELRQGDAPAVMNDAALNLAAQGKLDEALEILVKAQDTEPERVETERNLRIVTALKQADGPPAPKPGTKPASGRP